MDTWTDMSVSLKMSQVLFMSFVITFFLAIFTFIFRYSYSYALKLCILFFGLPNRCLRNFEVYIGKTFEKFVWHLKDKSGDSKKRHLPDSNKDWRVQLFGEFREATKTHYKGYLDLLKYGKTETLDVPYNILQKIHFIYLITFVIEYK